MCAGGTGKDSGAAADQSENRTGDSGSGPSNEHALPEVSAEVTEIARYQMGQ